MKLYHLLTAGLLVMACRGYAQQPTGIPGWKMENSSGAYVFTPPNNQASTGFSYTIMPLQKESPADMAAWTETTLKADLSKKGFTLDQAVSNQKIRQIYSCAASAHDNAGNKRVFTFFAYQLPGGNIRRALFNGPAGYSPYINQAAAHLAAFSKNELANGVSVRQPNNSLTDTKTAPATNQSPATSTGEVRGIILHKETKWSGTMAVPYEAAYLMFNDGSTLMYVDDDPYTLDIAQSKRTNAKNWGQWKQSGSDIILTYISSNGATKTEQWEKGRWRWAVPAARNGKISGSFTAISIGGGIAGAFSGVSKNLTLNSGGQFTLASSAATTYNGAGGSNGVYSSRDNAGTYVLNGFSIELHFNNGKVGKYSFYFFDSDKDMFGIGKSIYTPDSK